MMKLTSLIAPACLIAVLACNKPASTASTTAGTAGTTAGKGGAPYSAPEPQGISKLKALTIKDTKAGDGMLQGIKLGNSKPVQNGDLVALAYVGKLQDGTTFDTNHPGDKLAGKHDKPLVFYVGRGNVVPGLDQGVLGMVVGGERDLGIPPALGYRDHKAGPIPANSDLLFHIKLLDVVKPGEEAVYDFKELAPGSGRPIKAGDTVQIIYTEKLADGAVIDSNVGKAPFEFTIGEIPPRVISGLEKGVVGMKKGGERLLRVPPSIAFGTKLVKKVPANSTLIIQVKIVEVM